MQHSTRLVSGRHQHDQITQAASIAGKKDGTLHICRLPQSLIGIPNSDFSSSGGRRAAARPREASTRSRTWGERSIRNGKDAAGAGFGSRGTGSLADPNRRMRTLCQ